MCVYVYVCEVYIRVAFYKLNGYRKNDYLYSDYTKYSMGTLVTSIIELVIGSIIFSVQESKKAVY